MKKLAVRRLAFLVPVCSLLFPTAVFAADPGEDEYEAGRRAYYGKNYKGAEEHFGKAIQQGNRNPKAWLYSGHTFLANGQYERALKTYELLIKNFKDTEEAKVAKDSAEVAKIKIKDLPVPAVVEAPAPVTPPVAGAKKPVAVATKPTTVPGSTSLKDRIIVVAPLMGHQPVSAQSVKAIREAVANLPPHLRQKLDDAGATINIAPNLIDKWPNSMEDLDKEEQSNEKTLAEVPGRIYGKDMYIYERPKIRGSTNLGNSRPPLEIKHQVYNQCFQVLDDMMTISKDPVLRAEYNTDKSNVPESAHDKLWTFFKEDDWGPRETCSEIAADLFGQGGEFTDDLNRCFPKTKKWLKTKLLGR